MSLITEIKSAQLTARKDRNGPMASLLTTLIGEAEMVGKNAGREVLDAEVVATIKKFIKNIDETIKALGVEDARAQAAQDERVVLEHFLPRQMDEQQLTEAVTAIKAELNAGQKDMGKVMGLLKTRHEGQYDGKMASTVVKAVLA
jgi:uncharacterized protein YqeY